MKHRQATTKARITIAVCPLVCLLGGLSRPARALDPGKALSECSVETWRSSDGIVGWVRAITQSPDGYLWVGTNAGVFRYGGGPVVAFEPGRALARATDVVGLAVAPDGTLWITPARGAPVCLRRSGAGETLSECEGAGASPVAPPSLAGGQAPRVQDRDGNLWSGSRKGLTRTRPGRPPVTFTREDGLPEDDVTAIFEDREGSLWVGTRGGGLAQFTDRTLDARVGPPSLRDRWISAVVEDPAGVLWVGTRTGLTRWKDGAERVERTYTRADGLPADEVLSLLVGRGGELWVGTAAGVARVREGKLDAPIPSTEAASALYLDDDGGFWIGGSADLTRLPGGASFGKGERLPVDPGVELGEIRGMAHDDGGTLWLSAGGRLFRVEGGRVRLPPPEDAAIGKVRAFHRAADKSLWLATGDGLYRRQGGAWRLFGQADGLVPEDLTQVITDERGFLWAGSNQGVLRVSLQALTEVAAGRRRPLDAVSFATSDQRRNVEVVRAQPGAHRGQGGRLWFATSRGVIGVDPQRLRVNTLPPVVLIEQALVDGRPLRRGAPGSFPPGAGALEFHFAAITLREPRKALYRYRLEGFDPGWVEAGARREAYYTNIPPGSYRFYVIGSNADGVWNGTGDAVAVTLAPHFYETAWFYALAGLSAMALALSFHRMRVGQVKSRYHGTLTERTRVARELHDSLLQGMAAALLHIKSMRKRVARGAYPKVEAVTGELAHIEDLIVTNLEETRQFVWELREQTAEAPPTLAVALAQLVGRLGEDSPVQVRLHADGPLAPLARHTSREVLRIVHEAVANALKHAAATQVEVRLRQTGDVLEVSVRDDGRGFDASSAPGAATGHFGLIGMRERAASVGALRIESQPGRGTLVEIVVSAREPQE